MDQIKKRKYQKFFFISALYNFMAAANGMFFFNTMSRMCFRTVPPYGMSTFILKTFYTHVLVFGLGYHIVSRDPEKNRGIVWMGMAAKIAFFFAAIPYYLRRKITALTLLLAFGDFVFGVFYGLFLLDTRKDLSDKAPTKSPPADIAGVSAESYLPA